MTDEDRQYIPKFLGGYPEYNPSTEAGYTKLYRRLMNQPEVIPEPLGPPLVLSSVSTSVPLPPAQPYQTLSDSEQQTKQRILALAFAYQQMRQKMLPSDERTLNMEIIATKMRALACEGYFLRRTFAVATRQGAGLRRFLCSK